MLLLVQSRKLSLYEKELCNEMLSFLIFSFETLGTPKFIVISIIVLAQPSYERYESKD